MGNDPGADLVDLIDDAGRTIGIVSRREMRARRLPHRCVYLLVFNDAGDLFIHLRTPTKDVFPAHWDVCVGGVLTAGETFEQGANREGVEELGVDLKPCPLFPFRYEDDRTVVQAMVYQACHNGPFRLQPEEVVRGEFVPLTALEARIQSAPFCPDGLDVLREYRRRMT